MYTEMYRGAANIIPVRPMPAEQWTTIGGPRGWLVHVSPIAVTSVLCMSRILCRNSSMAVADRGTP
jgi:hypothetical protein